MFFRSYFVVATSDILLRLQMRLRPSPRCHLISSNGFLNLAGKHLMEPFVERDLSRQDIIYFLLNFLYI